MFWVCSTSVYVREDMFVPTIHHNSKILDIGPTIVERNYVFVSSSSKRNITTLILTGSRNFMYPIPFGEALFAACLSPDSAVETTTLMNDMVCRSGPKGGPIAPFNV